MNVKNEFKAELLSYSANEAFARSMLAAFAAQADPTLEEIGDIKTAVSEAVTNAIVHGYPDSIGTIYIRGRIYEGNILEIIIRDKGIGIEDVSKALTPMYSTGGAERAGMGFTIMESFMNTLQVRSKVGQGTTVTMRRRINMRLSR